MKKLHNITNAKGITLVELLIYMSLLTVLIGIMFSIIFYVQRVLTKYDSTYAARVHVYEYLYVLQQQLYQTAYIDNQSPGSMILYMYDAGTISGLVSIQHRIQEGRLFLDYTYTDHSRDKSVGMYEYTRFNALDFTMSSSSAYVDTACSRGIIHVHVGVYMPDQSRLDILQDLYIPNLQ